MTIQIDTREKQKAIIKIISEFEKQNIKYYSSKLFVGDYMNLDNPRLIIDRKQNLAELVSNVCQQHKRFKAELLRAKENGIKIIILCEHSGSIKNLDDVKGWTNPRLKNSPLAMSGERLYKVLSTMSNTYDVDFVFCDKLHTGKKIIEILSNDS